MSWFIKGVFDFAAQLRNRVQVSRSGAGVLHTSAGLPLAVGDAFVLEATLNSSGVQRWAQGVVRARGTGVVTLELPEARQLLRRQSIPAVLARRSPRLWAGLDVQLSGPELQPTRGLLLEISADGARVGGDFGPAGREVDLSLQLPGALVPLARARIRWRTPQLAGLELIELTGGEVQLSRLLRVLANCWRNALPLLAAGAPAPRSLPARPPSLPALLALELSPQARARATAAGDEERREGVSVRGFLPET